MEDGGNATSRLPLAVLVSGAPGSGKSTLAIALAAGLDVPVLHKDQLVHGIWRTRNRAMELGAPGVEPFYRTMETWLDLGVSFVAEQTFYRGVSEPDVARRLAPRSVLVNVHCRSEHALERFERRMRADPLCGEARLGKLSRAGRGAPVRAFRSPRFRLPLHRREHRRRVQPANAARPRGDRRHVRAARGPRSRPLRFAGMSAGRGLR